MRHQTKRILTLFILALSFFAPATADANMLDRSHQQQGLADFPTVDPNYIYDQLFYMATNYQHREAGYDNNFPVNVNGHDEFAAYWSQEIVKDLQGFGPQVRQDKFIVKGWVGRPATVPVFNVEVSIPGLTHPEQVVVIGCHYDGEAVSTQSANDDGSGCAIELGIAKAMGEYWRSHHIYPARTLRFVIFDAEEQGLYGSFHYLNSTINGDVGNLVAMFNEEQNGIAYPLRYLGKMSNPLLPFFIDMSPLQNNNLYRHQSNLSQVQRNNITHFRALMQQAVVAAFAQFQALGFQSLNYYDDTHNVVSQAVFTSDHMSSNVRQEDDTLGGSDQIPFTLAGLPCATFVGNSTYYDSNPPPWSYPFDQPQDTLQMMNTFASGSSQKAQALVLALALPGMLTAWMLNQPDILGQAPVDNNPLVAISDIGETGVGQSITLDAKTAFDPNNSKASFIYAWNFGDGSTASGDTVTHTYQKTGDYTLMLTVSSQPGKRSVSKVIHVVAKTTNYDNPYAGYEGDGDPPHNPAVVLPVPNDNQPGKTSTTTSSSPLTTGMTGTAEFRNILSIVVVSLGLLTLVVIVLVRRR